MSADPDATGPRDHPSAGAPDTRRFLARVLAVGAVIVALAFLVWARACGNVSRCVEAGGRWDEEWKVCRQ